MIETANTREARGVSESVTVTSNSLMQAREFGPLGPQSKMRATALPFEITDAKAVGLPNIQGLYTSEAFYWNRNDDSRASCKQQPLRGHSALSLPPLGTPSARVFHIHGRVTSSLTRNGE
jgi:hypothetical protein